MNVVTALYLAPGAHPPARTGLRKHYFALKASQRVPCQPIDLKAILTLDHLLPLLLRLFSALTTYALPIAW
jgi:hypothetical protein